MVSIALDALVGSVRCLQPHMAKVPDPYAEMMAMVWGPRFDRAHAVDLLLQESPADPALLICMTTAADHFDTLGPGCQQRLRRLIMAHRGRNMLRAQAVDNADHATHSAH